MRSQLLQIVCVLILFLAITLYTSADSYKAIGPGGQTIYSMALNDRNPSIVFAVVSGAKRNTAILARSTDAGSTWMNTRFGEDVEQVIVHPQSSEVFVVLRLNDSIVAELWVSSNNGKTFQLRTRWEDYFNQEFRIDSTSSNLMYRIGYSKVLRSENGGRTWLSIDLPKRYQSCEVRSWNISDLASVEGELFVTAIVELRQCSISRFINTVLRSRDQGRTWKYLKTFPLDPGDPYSSGFKIHSLTSDRIYLYGIEGLAVLTSEQVKTLSTIPFAALSTDPDNSQRLIGLGFVLGLRRMWKSNDAGTTWFEDPDNLSFSILSIQALNDGADGILAGTDAGLFYKNEKQSWQIRNNGLPKAAPYQAFRLSQSGTRIYYLFGDRFLYRKDGPDKPWQNLSANYSLEINERFVAVAVNPGDPDHVILVAVVPFDVERGKVLISNDGGIHWFRSNVRVRGAGITFDHSNLKRVYFWDDFGIYKSNDKGFTAVKITNLRNVSQVLVDPNNSNTLFIIADWFYKSTNGGLTVTQLSAPPQKRAAAVLTALPSKDSFLLATTLGVVHRTDDGGYSWKRLSKVDLQPDPWQECDHLYYCSPKELHAASSTHYYLITAQDWFYESKDAGKTWVLNNRDYFEAYGEVYSMTDPKLEPFYLGTTRGIFQHVP